MESEKRKRGRPGIYESSAERSKAWRDRQKTRTAIAEAGAISSALSSSLWDENVHTPAQRLFENAPKSASAARDLLELLSHAAIPLPETERAFLDNVATFFDGVSDIVRDSYFGEREKIAKRRRARDEIEVREMGNIMARLVRRANADGLFLNDSI